LVFVLFNDRSFIHRKRLAMKKWILSAAFIIAISGYAAAQGTPIKTGPKKEEAKTVMKGIEAKEGSSKKISGTVAKDSTLKLQIPNIPPDTLAIPPKGKKEG
jgi:hypothetical protein